MKPAKLKAALIEKAIENLEGFITNLRADVKVFLRGEGSTDEGGFSGSKGDFSAVGQENALREQAQISRLEVEKHENLINQLRAVNVEDSCDAVCLGALVETNHGTFFFTQALRPIVLNGATYHFLGTEAPIYAVMAGKKAGEVFSFREISYTIISVM